MVRARQTESVRMGSGQFSARNQLRSGKSKSFARQMSDHVAMALVVYTLLLIFLVTPAIETKGLSIVPYFLLILLVAAIIPVFRRLDRRWTMLDGSELSYDSLQSRFNIDRAKLWIVTIAVPLILVSLFRAISAAL